MLVYLYDTFLQGLHAYIVYYMCRVAYLNAWIPLMSSSVTKARCRKTGSTCGRAGLCHQQGGKFLPFARRVGGIEMDLLVLEVVVELGDVAVYPLRLLVKVREHLGGGSKGEDMGASE